MAKASTSADLSSITARGVPGPGCSGCQRAHVACCEQAGRTWVPRSTRYSSSPAQTLAVPTPQAPRVVSRPPLALEKLRSAVLGTATARRGLARREVCARTRPWRSMLANADGCCGGQTGRQTEAD